MVTAGGRLGKRQIDNLAESIDWKKRLEEIKKRANLAETGKSSTKEFNKNTTFEKSDPFNKES